MTETLHRPQHEAPKCFYFRKYIQYNLDFSFHSMVTQNKKNKEKSSSTHLDTKQSRQYTQSVFKRLQYEIFIVFHKPHSFLQFQDKVDM